MKKRTQILSLLMLSAAVAAPASAERVLSPVAAKDLTSFVGKEIFGDANSELGVVAEVDSRIGLLGVAGRNGEFAVLHTSLLKRDGLRLYAPAISVAYLKSISTQRSAQPRMAAVAKPTLTPSVTIEEQPYTIEPYDKLPPSN